MINQNLKSLRKNKKLTQQELAEDLGITRSFYGMIEIGRRNPTLKLAFEISKYFERPVDEIFPLSHLQ